MYFDIFNGDADGICALHQLRLKNPQPDQVLITGVKRDINLLSKEELQNVRDCQLTVLDVSLDSNRDALLDLLERNNTVTYIDHHSASPIPENALLTTHIVFSPDVCTSLLANEMLQNSYAAWAVCGAFGDNLHLQASELAQTLALTEGQVEKLKEIGELLNYNGYGSDIDDLHFHPKDLYLAVRPYEDPLAFWENSEQLKSLKEGYQDDMDQALSCKPHDHPGKNRLYILPDAPWARRISGVFSNLKAREKTEAAHALVTENPDSTLRISVRAPLNDKRDAGKLCKRFPTGGGREAAAGINSLPEDQLDAFLAAFNETYP